jgi:hypothetical protein
VGVLVVEFLLLLLLRFRGDLTPSGVDGDSFGRRAGEEEFEIDLFEIDDLRADDDEMSISSDLSEDSLRLRDRRGVYGLLLLLRDEYLPPLGG